MAVLVLLAVGIGAVLFFTREPSADGRTLSEWLALRPGGLFIADQTDVTNAVLKIGTKAIPVLLRKIGARDAEWKIKFHERYGDYRWGKNFSYDWSHTAHEQQEQAEYGFLILGNQAVGAIPQLSTMLADSNRDRDIGLSAATALYRIGPSAWPLLKAALTNPAPLVRENSLASLYNNAQGEDITQFWPYVLRLCNDSNSQVRSFAILLIGQHFEQPESADVIIHALTDPNVDTIERALIELMLPNIHANALRTIPALLPLLAHTNAEVRWYATNALFNIDPATARKLGISVQHSPRTY